MNQLTGQDDIIDVCAEETLEEIRERYTKYNAHAKGYTWRRLGKPLDMSKTLEENGIPVRPGYDMPACFQCTHPSHASSTLK